MGSWSRRTCSIYLTLLMVLVLLAGVLATGSRVRSRKHRTSPGRTAAAAAAAAKRWQSRASIEGAMNAIHETAAKPAPFSKPSHGGSSTKRAYYVPTVTNLENKLHHFLNNLRTGIGASKLAHAVNSVTGAFQPAAAGQPAGGQTPASFLAGNPYRQHYGSTANELRYGQPFVASKQAASSHFKSAIPSGYGAKGLGGKRSGRQPGTAAPPGKYDSLMSDLGISGYKHFENAVIRDLERREELKVEATIHTLFPEATGDDEWRPIAAASKKPAGLLPAPIHEQPQETKVVPALVSAPAEKTRPPVMPGSRALPKPVKPATNVSKYVSTSTASPKPTIGQKHRQSSKGSGYQATKEKRPKERTKCWNNCNVSSTVPPKPRHSSPIARLTPLGGPPPRFGPTYDSTMFYGSNGESGKLPATLGSLAQSYSNVEVHYNRTLAPPFASVPWTQVRTGDEVSTQPAPPATTFSAIGLPETAFKKSFSSKHVVHKAYGDGAVTSTTTHKPTGGSQGTKVATTAGVKPRKRTAHKPVDGALAGLSQPGRRVLGDSVPAGSSKSEHRVRKKYEQPHGGSRNRGSIKFKDALRQNPDQLYR